MAQSADAPSIHEGKPLSLDQKYCTECGKVILRKAEICPGCGCRQSFPSMGRTGQNLFGSARSSPELESSFVTNDGNPPRPKFFMERIGKPGYRRQARLGVWF